MDAARVRRDSLFASLPPERDEDPLPDIRAEIRASGQKLVVLDDDPTGTQTVCDIPVLTGWTVDMLRAELADDAPAVYLLTNSRSLPLAAAQAVNAEIGAHLATAARQAGRQFVVASRSDSTLRGHFPGEVDALAAALGGGFDAVLLVPAFMAGGRYTIGDVHYVQEGDWLVPAGETEFARDAVFGYAASNLRAWVAEKTQGRVAAETVASIALDDVRGGGAARVAERLLALKPGSVCAVNAASDRDLAVAALGVLRAEAQGRRFLYRTAASFVAARAGLAPRPLLTPAELNLPERGGGLVIIGSYVPKTTRQLQSLLEKTPVAPVEVRVEALLDDSARESEVRRAVEAVNQGLAGGENVAVFTSRRLITGADAESSLRIGRRVSESMVRIARRVTERPRYVLAKGGVTSSDMATKGLEVARAMVLGQILPGVPVWRLGAESRYPGLAYIVFPGNVGSPDALADVVRALAAERKG